MRHTCINCIYHTYFHCVTSTTFVMIEISFCLPKRKKSHAFRLDMWRQTRSGSFDLNMAMKSALVDDIRSEYEAYKSDLMVI